MKPLKFAENIKGVSKGEVWSSFSSLFESWAAARSVGRFCTAAERCVMFGLNLSARPAEAPVNTAADGGDCEPSYLWPAVSPPPLPPFPQRLSPSLQQCTGLLWRCWTRKALRCVSQPAASSPTWPWSLTTGPASCWRAPPPSKFEVSMCPWLLASGGSPARADSNRHPKSNHNGRSDDWAQG